jgi:hypothetical protein
VAKPKHSRAATTDSGRNHPTAPRDRTSDMMFAIWAALAIYLVLFYMWPIGQGVSQTDTRLRRGHAFVSVFLGDEIVVSWVDGCTWASLAERGQILAVAAAILGTAIVGGWLCLSVTGVCRQLTRLETFVFSSGVGLLLASLTTLVLGLAGVLRVELFASLGAAVLVLGATRVWRQRSRLPGSDTDLSDSSKTLAVDHGLHLSDRWVWLMVPFAVVIVLGAMLPPVEFDVREYHLQAPKEFFLSGRITFLPHNVYANMPLGAEMLSLLGMVVCGDWQTGALVGKTLIALFAPLAALGLVAAGRRLVTPAAGVIAGLAYISIPWVALVSMQGLIEGVVAFYLFAALFAALLWHRYWAAGESSYRLLGLAGLMAGGGVSCKYPTVVFSVVPLAAWIAGVGLKSLLPAASSGSMRARLTRAVAPLCLFLLACALACGLWLGKNGVMTGNPVYPLLYDWFDGLTRTADKNIQWTRAHGPPNFDLVDLVRRLAEVMLSSIWTSPLVVPLGALALTAWRRRPLVRGLVAYFVYVMAVWWLFTHRIDRFWVPILPVLALLSGIGATWADTRTWRITLAALLAIGLVGNFATISNGVMGENRFLAELDTLRHDSGHVDAWHSYLNEHKDEVSRVLLVGDAQPFDLEVPVLYNTVFDDSIFEQIAKGKTDRQIRVALDDLGVSHIYVAWGEVARYRSPGNYGFTRFVTRRVFDDLVADGVLQELPKINDQSGQMFRVVPLRRAYH